MEKAWVIKNPNVPFSIPEAMKERTKDRSKAKARATKIKNSAKPSSNLVGGGNRLATSSHATGKK